MITLQVSLNGEKIKIAGSENLSVLTALICATGKLGSKSTHSVKNSLGYDLFLKVGGLSSTENKQHIDWINNPKLKIGDEITIKILESKISDKPIESSGHAPN